MSNEKSYGVSFDTKSHHAQGMIGCVMVTIRRDVIGLDESVDISLRDDPLYPALEQYVLNNPSAGRKK